MDTKSIFSSKIFWANAVSLIALIATASGHPAATILGSPDVQAQVIAGATAAVNIILRLVTKQPVHIAK